MNKHTYKLNAALVAFSLFAAAAPITPAFADRGSDDRQQDDRGGDDRGGSNGGASSQTAQRLRLVARAGNDNRGPKVKAVYEERARNSRRIDRKFTAEVENANPGDKYDVRVNGKLVGTMTVNSLRRAELELRPRPSSANESRIPSDFPRLKAGDTVQIGRLSAKFRQR